MNAWFAPMVRAARLSRDHYLEYGGYAQLEVRVHSDATITGRILRRDGADEVHQMRIAQRTIAAYSDTGSTASATGSLPI